MENHTDKPAMQQFMKQRTGNVEVILQKKLSGRNERWNHPDETVGAPKMMGPPPWALNYRDCLLLIVSFCRLLHQFFIPDGCRGT